MHNPLCAGLIVCLAIAAIVSLYLAIVYLYLVAAVGR